MKKRYLLVLTTLLLMVSLALGGVLSGCKTSYDNGNDNGNGYGQAGIFEKISVAEAYGLIWDNTANTNFAILDVRTAEEFNSGHIEGAVNIDFYASDFESRLDMLDKDRVYLVYCRSDARSGQAVDKMEGLGFAEVYDMSGGINAWNDNGYPTVQ